MTGETRIKAIASTLLGMVLITTAFAANAGHTIEVVDRHLYGPGPFPDQKLKTAWIRNLNFENFLNGTVSGSNNLGQEPNVSGEALQGKTVDGMLSDKTLINEAIDMSNAVIMNGQFNLLLAAVFGGPNKGDTFFYTDEDYNWWIKDDIAIDPGFAAGIVKIDDFTFTTGPRVIPPSIQTEMGYPGGTNQIGSLESGRVAMGRLGDDDGDGYIDGVFNALGHFPMDAIFLPGAPFVQLFEFKSDISITPLQAALLSIASARSFIEITNKVSKENKKHEDIVLMQEKISERLEKALGHLQKVVGKGNCTDCEKLKEVISVLEAESKSAGINKVKPIVENAFNVIREIHEKQNA